MRVERGEKKGHLSEKQTEKKTVPVIVPFRSKTTRRIMGTSMTIKFSHIMILFALKLEN